MAAVGLAFFYFALRSQNHPVDAVLYALAADVKDAYPFFHWHHLLYTPLSWLVLNLARLFGYGGDAFAPIAALSAAPAGAAAALLYLSLRRLGATRAGATLAAGAAAFSAAWWYFAGEAEVLALLTLFISGALYGLTKSELTTKGVVGLALWLGVGTLCHQVVSLFVPVAAIVIAWGDRGRVAKLSAFFATYVVVAAVPYLLIPFIYYGVRGWSGWVTWATHYFWWGDWGYLYRERLARGFLTMLSAVAAGPNPFDLDKTLPTGTFLKNYGPATLAYAGVLGTVAAAAGNLWRTKRRWLIAAVAWFVLFHLFFSWWEPENVEWWIATTMPLWLLFGLAAPPNRKFRVAAASVLLGVATLNFNRLIYPATLPGENEAEAAARTIVSATQPGDAVFVAHVDVNFWIDYLSRHTRNLPSAQPFSKPPPDAAPKLERAASRGFPEYTGQGRNLYFTDFEWDDPFLFNRAGADDLKVVFFKMIRGAEPVTTLRFPGGSRVLYRYTTYGGNIRDVSIYEAEGDNGSEERAVLSYTGAAVAVKVNVIEKGQWVLAVEASGRQAEGVWPLMEVVLDGKWFVRTAVDTPFWRFYEMTYDLSAGPHDLKISFLNDYCDPATGSDRDLYVNRIILYRTEPGGINFGLKSASGYVTDEAVE